MAEVSRSDRATVRDLVALTALPGLWSNRGVTGIATALADAMLSMLRLQAVCVRATGVGETPSTAVRCAMADVPDADVESLLEPWIRGERGRDAIEVVEPRTNVTLRATGIPFGIDGEDGALVAASTRPDFPTEQERVLLGVAANLAVISIREVRGRERERRATLEAREAATIVETINRIGQMLVGQKDLKALIQAVTDEATRLSGAQFGAFFFNVVGGEGEVYALYTISGAPREAFAGFPTFRGEGIIRIDDVRADPRYGHSGHLPVASYLAVPVVSRSGDVIGGLFFGHAERAMFSERMEAIMAGVSAQTAIAIDNARLFEQEQRARDTAEAASATRRRRSSSSTTCSTWHASWRGRCASTSAPSISPRSSRPPSTPSVPPPMPRRCGSNRPSIRTRPGSWETRIACSRSCGTS
jgi:hypothetical protein